MQKLKTSLLNVVDLRVISNFVKFEDDRIVISNGREKLIITLDSVDNYLMTYESEVNSEQEVLESVFDAFAACMVVIAKFTFCPLGFGKF